MFILAALICTSMEITSCNSVIYPKQTYISEAACEKSVPDHAAEFNKLPLAMWKLYCYRIPGTDA